MSEPETYKYWAFISYSHADEAWARWLHRSLEAYRVPERLVGRETGHGPVPKKLFPVFRDRDELAGSSELGPELERALEQSRFLIVIASPRAARSRWVDEEIRRFKALGRSGRVLAFIVDGEPGASQKNEPERECFPPALRFQVDETGQLTDQPAEPVGADARNFADGKQNAKLKLIAGILGLPFDDLKQRELQARNRRLGFITATATLIASVTVVLAALAYQARNDALRRQEQAEDLLQFMLGDLREKLEPIGKLAILDAVGEKAMEHFAALDEEDLTDRTLASRATALRQIGDVRIKQGDTAGAIEALTEALKLDMALVERHPKDIASLKNVEQSEYWMGYAHYVKGEIEQARPWWERRVATATHLAELEPENELWRYKIVEAEINLGVLAVANKDLERAEESFLSALSQQQAFLQKDPENTEYLDTFAKIYGWLSTIEGTRRAWAQALDYAQIRTNLLRKLVQLSPENANFRYQLVGTLITAMNFEARIKPLQPEAPRLQETLQLAKGLSERDPENIEYLRYHTVALNRLVEAHLASRNLRQAEDVADQVLVLARRTYEKAPATVVVIEDLVAALTQRAKIAWLRNDIVAAERNLLDAARLPLTEQQKTSVSAWHWLDLHLLQWGISDSGARQGQAAKASEWLERASASGVVVQPDLMLRYEALKGNRIEAKRWFAKLSPGEKRDPFLKRFCQDYAVCGS